MIRANQTNI